MFSQVEEKRDKVDLGVAWEFLWMEMCSVEEGDKEVELGGGEVAKVHRVEHQHSTAHVDRAEKRCSPGREFQKWQKVKMSSPARRQSFKE